MADQSEALRLAKNLTAPWALRTATAVDAAAELLRLHDENEMLRQQHLEAHRNSSTIFAALVEISLLTHLGGEVAEYGDVVEAVRRLHAENERLKRTLAASCDEERSQLWEAGPGGGCARALDAELKCAELLEALKEIYEWTQYKDTPWAVKARAAIAKATGEQP